MAKNSKIGRKKRKPAQRRYVAEGRYHKNKARRLAKAAARLDYFKRRRGEAA